MSEKYRLSHFDAQSEAEKLRQIVETGQVKGYGEAEKFLQTQIESLPIVENKELGVSYREVVEELPPELQEQTGIKRLRRRKVISYPDFLYTTDCFDKGRKAFQIYGDNKEKARQIWDFLTNGRFLTQQTWSHEMNADREAERSEAEKNFFEGESFFQEFFPRKNLKTGIPIDFFRETEDGNFVRLDNEEQGNYTEEEAEKKISAFSMSVSVADGGHNFEHPTFIFGKNNKAFIDYINNVTSNPKLLKIIKSMEYGWETRSPVKKSKRGEVLPDRNIAVFEHLFNDEVFSRESYHPYIPIVRHPDVKRPFRWCNAELAILPQGKELEIVFFETE